ncbi:MAG: hypothetical protein IJS15_05705 [Victivallales bacterium]|nr:hypothetical protein [Victivallales bacterium]
MKKENGAQKRLSNKCEMLFHREVRDCCVRNGQYSDNIIKNVASAVFPEFVRKRFKCQDDSDFLYFNADVIEELVKKCLTRNLTHFRYRDRKLKFDARRVCRRAAPCDFVFIGLEHKYIKYKQSLEEFAEKEYYVKLVG